MNTPMLMSRRNIEVKISNHDYETISCFCFLVVPGAQIRVVDAVNTFCSGWHRSNATVKTALTGKAATHIGGRTLASFLIRLEHAIKEKKFKPLDLLVISIALYDIVIDEISMVSKTEWVKLDRLLRRYMKVENVPFDAAREVRLNLLSPIGKANPNTMDIGGFDLWRTISTVVVLDESGYRNARLGRWIPEFLDMVSARVIQCTNEYNNPPSLQEKARTSAVFVTPENTTRLAINNAFMMETADRQPEGVHPIRVVANFKGALNGLSRSDLEYVLGLPDNRFGRMAPYLDLVPGMPIQVTQNVATAKGVANGTLGSLAYVHFPPETEFRLVQDGSTSTVVQLPSQPPDYALICVPSPTAVAIRPD
ncbi:LOW QUALITY PROTEIN: hypothetical protein PHMEG_00011006 [Phytophthora megakarya]|uniref:Uncharacterized protein n=1 Tax=Phytophthora megakarya TaxID=4795 RepID=A0A225WCA1_9STRA|nr:LOW QUALITY PROTEIN: hypothetical protein PHMEG_00011006 [Phytophthora megakarya]